MTWPTTELTLATRQSSSGALLARVSALYYLDGRTQDDIARRLQLSRMKVSRLLGAARDAGIARIRIRPPPGTFVTLETELEARFGLREVRIVPSSCDEPAEAIRRRLGVAAAADLARSARAGQTVGLVGTELLAFMVDAAVPNVASGVRVVQGVGWEHAPTPQRTLMDLVLDLARRIAGTAVLLPAPSLVDNEQLRRSLEADPQISDALRTLDAIETLYTEVSPPAPAVAVVRDEIPAGHIALRHFDLQGVMLGSAADGHVIGLSIEQLYRTRHIVALAHGPAHAPVIAAAMHTRLIGTLITDELTAQAIAALSSSRAEIPSAGALRPEVRSAAGRSDLIASRQTTKRRGPP